MENPKGVLKNKLRKMKATLKRLNNSKKKIIETEFQSKVNSDKESRVID